MLGLSHQPAKPSNSSVACCFEFRVSQRPHAGVGFGLSRGSSSKALEQNQLSDIPFRPTRQRHTPARAIESDGTRSAFRRLSLKLPSKPNPSGRQACLRHVYFVLLLILGLGRECRNIDRYLDSCQSVVERHTRRTTKPTKINQYGVSQAYTTMSLPGNGSICLVPSSLYAFFGLSLFQ